MTSEINMISLAHKNWWLVTFSYFDLVEKVIVRQVLKQKDHVKMLVWVATKNFLVLESCRLKGASHDNTVYASMLPHPENN